MMKQQLDSNKKEQEILDLWNIINDTQCEYSKDKFIYMLFEEQAKKWPDKVAIICSDQQYTYGELNQKINALAAPLVRMRGQSWGNHRNCGRALY